MILPSLADSSAVRGRARQPDGEYVAGQLHHAVVRDQILAMQVVRR